jgi:ribosomal protein S25
MKVSNPLTIIAIFSGLAETLATVALIQLPTNMQEIFIYFVMAFPASIVLLFFFILYTKNTVLYAPSDYDDQNHYLEINRIKEKASQELESFFFEINKNGMRLTKEEIDKAKNNLEVTIENTASSSISKGILDYLKDGSASYSEIAKRFEVSNSVALKILRKMERNGLIVREKSSNNIGTWKLNT